MSNEYPNTGALFRTKEKKHEKAPDMNGVIKFDKYFLLEKIEESNGALIEIKIDGWSREAASGNKYLSLKVNTWKPQEQRTSVEPKPQVSEDDIPF